MRVKTIIDRLKMSPDREWEQSIVRVVVVTLLLGYILFLQLFMTFDERYGVLNGIALLYLFVALCIVAAISINPKRYRLRRQLTMLFDVSMASWAMWVGGECMSLLWSRCSSRE